MVATSAIQSGPFWRSVVYVLDHDEDGALGDIVNHPLESDVDEVLPEWADCVNAPLDFMAVRSALGKGQNIPAEAAADPAAQLKSLVVDRQEVSL